MNVRLVVPYTAALTLVALLGVASVAAMNINPPPRVVNAPVCHISEAEGICILPGGKP